MDEKMIQHHMQTLKCTRDEAIQLIKDDADVDRGVSKPWDLTAEQKANQRKLTRAGTRKTSGAVNRTKKDNPAKRAIIKAVADALTMCDSVIITNAERTIDFTGADGVSYTLTLTAHRAKKTD